MKAEIPIRMFGPEEGEIPADAWKIKHLGCPESRQVEVFEMGAALFVREPGGGHVGMIELSTALNKMFAAVIKANDGMHRDVALPRAFRKPD